MCSSPVNVRYLPEKKYLQDYNFPTGKKSFPIGHLEEFEFR